MRNHLKLASFLNREKSLCLNILSIMTIKNISQTMVLEIPSFVENLLNLEHGNHENQDNIMLHGFFKRSFIYSSHASRICFILTKRIRGKTLQVTGSVS